MHVPNTEIFRVLTANRPICLNGLNHDGLMLGSINEIIDTSAMSIRGKNRII